MADPPTPGAADPMFEGSVARLLGRLALPIYLGMLFWVVYTVTDIYWISRIDPADPAIVAGVSLIMPVYMLAFAISNGLLNGVKSLVARAVGAENQRTLDEVAAAGLLLASILAGVFLLTGYLFPTALTEVLGAMGDLARPAQDFLVSVLPAAAMLFLFNVLSGIAQGEGQMQPVMRAMGVGVGLNLVLDPLFIFGFGWGVLGAGFATSLAQAVSLTYLALQFRKARLRVPLRIDLHRARADTMAKILQVGLPQGLAEILVACFLLALNWIVVTVDPRAMTAFGLCARVDQVLLLVLAALASALLTIVAQNAARSAFLRVRTALLQAMAWGGGLVLLQAAALYGIAPWVYSLLSDVPEVIDFAVRQTRVVAFFYAFAAITLASQAFFLAVGHPWPGIAIQFAKMFLISLPLALGLALLFDWGMAGVWLGMIAGEAAAAALSLWLALTALRRLARGTLKVAAS